MVEQLLPFIVETGHRGIRIEVIDSHLNVVARGYDRIEKNLPPGYYTVRYLAADAREDRNVIHAPERAVNLMVGDTPALEFASAVPLDLTRTLRNYHQHNAHRLSLATPLECGQGQGAGIFLFVRDLEPGAEEHPAAGLSLHLLNGKTVVEFEAVAEIGDSTSEACWAGCNITVNPGPYCLRWTMPEGEAVEMAVHACPGWQSQIFIVRQPSRMSLSGVEQRLELNLLNAAQFLVRPTDGFEPQRADDELRLAELTRVALMHGGEDMARDYLESLFVSARFNPLLGMFSVHLLLTQPDPDLALAGRFIQELKNSLQDYNHSDLQALDLEVSRRQGLDFKMGQVLAPPTLRRSWQMLVRASADTPPLIPADALAGQIGERLWGHGTWLLWRKLKEATWKVENLRPQLSGPANVSPRTRSIDRNLYDFEHSLQIENWFGKDKKPTDNDKPSDELLIRFVLRELDSPNLTMKFTDSADLLKTLFDRDAGCTLLERRLNAGPIPAKSETGQLQDVLNVFHLQLIWLLEEHGFDELAEKVALSEAETVLLAYLDQVLSSQRQRPRGSVRKAFDLVTMVTSLGLPAGQIESVLATLILKLVWLATQERYLLEALDPGVLLDLSNSVDLRPTAIDRAFIEAITAISSSHQGNDEDLLLHFAKMWALPRSLVTKVGQRVLILAAFDGFKDRQKYLDKLLEQLQVAPKKGASTQLWLEIVNSFADTFKTLKLLGLILSKTKAGAQKLVEAVCNLLNQPSSKIVWEFPGAIPCPGYPFDERSTCFIRLNDSIHIEILQLNQEKFSLFDRLVKEANRDVVSKYDNFSVMDARKKLDFEARQAW